MWKPEYSIGNLLLDGEHKQILDLLSAYLENRLSPQEADWDFLRKILFDHVTIHFIHEETLMNLYSYAPEAKLKHLEEHRLLKDLCVSQLGDPNARPLCKEATFGTANHLLKVFEDHIASLDKELAPLFKKESNLKFKSLQIFLINHHNL